ncbi:hypothetical protein FRC12_021267, partial [Ceratobasidium sp. 428]
MLLSLAVIPGLLATSTFASNGFDRSYRSSGVIEAPDEYLQYAKEHGMCRPHKFSLTKNLARPMAVPGPRVLTNFTGCVAKNEFHEDLPDYSGLIFCQGPTIHLMADAMNHEDSKTF